MFRNKPLNLEEARRSHSVEIIIICLHQKIHDMAKDGKSGATENPTPMVHSYGKGVLIGVTKATPDKAMQKKMDLTIGSCKLAEDEDEDMFVVDFEAVEKIMEKKFIAIGATCALGIQCKITIYFHGEGLTTTRGMWSWEREWP
jgi:hypothetical protein